MKKLEFIDFLRATAVMLITNSHFDGVYPLNISWGGAPGVALFFLISGFCTVIKNDLSFKEYFLKKVLRLYLPLTLVNILTIFIGYRKISAGLLLFPINTNLWYVPAGLLLYIAYYFTQKYLIKQYHILFGVLLAGYFILYIFIHDQAVLIESMIWSRLFYGFFAMLLGGILRIRHENKKILNKKISNKKIFSLAMAGLCITGFLSVKLFMNDYIILQNLQFMTQFFSVAFSLYIFLFMYGYETILQAMKDKVLLKIVRMISECSLEIYLIQFLIIDFLKKIIFPVNFLLIVIAILVTAKLINLLKCFLIRRLSVLNL